METIIQSISDKKISFEKHFIVEKESQTTISSLQSNISNVSTNRLKLAMKYGAVWLTSENRKTSRVSKAKKELKNGDKLSIYYDEIILFSDIKPAELISDEGGYSIWNKPCGMFSQGTKWGNHTSISRWVELFGFEKYHLEKRPTFLVHRLDRATSGLIVVAHSKKATQFLTKLFENRRVEKKYQAVVQGKLPQSLVLKEITETIDGKRALTIILSSSYEPYSDQSSLLVQIKTGRKHQIRKHLAGLGFPIIGDRLYGQSSCKQLSDLKLQSCYLEFVCPLTQDKKSYALS